ncbi:hypothetical protein I6A60_31275 [Frankia sp. AgB1.9]|uniref:hypothetical protein n=1 Tax=unclassified Frankia TaxID=2632575 RepID=UPI00193476BF|nr:MULTISPECIES: hypothetical protein [unclassified Frankia]MBL7493889.1 hypothetical protein [Frankia sp. AgW1.1]MBL7552312.1 hypothetical protein [Frankia sp. AgB1.9]MBL7622065.1 hypothetical protein [Frankia sp. AgB1.8]
MARGGALRAAHRSQRRRGAQRAGTLSFACDSSPFARLYERAANWDQVLDAQLRAELGAAANKAARQAQREALRLRLPGDPPSPRRQGGRSTGLRSDIARSVNVVLRQAGNGIEYRLTAGHMAAVTNAPSFRHPVFGNRRVWAKQASKPWWNQAMRAAEPDMRAAAQRAVSRAIRRI